MNGARLCQQTERIWINSESLYAEDRARTHKYCLVYGLGLIDGGEKGVSGWTPWVVYRCQMAVWALVQVQS